MRKHYDFSKMKGERNPYIRQSRAKASRFVEYLKSLEGFRIADAIDGDYCHMGATITDAILQAGLTYDTVVRPRIKAIRENYPWAVTTSAFRQLLRERGPKAVLAWKDEEKPNRIVGLTDFLLREGIETEAQLRDWVADEDNRDRLLQVRGIGQKTADYIGILVGSQTVAVDRHLIGLVMEAGIETSSYADAREILNLAADTMGVDRRFFDHSIWQFMSRRGGTQSRTGHCKKRGKA